MSPTEFAKETTVRDTTKKLAKKAPGARKEKALLDEKMKRALHRNYRRYTRTGFRIIFSQIETVSLSRKTRNQQDKVHLSLH